MPTPYENKYAKRAARIFGFLWFAVPFVYIMLALFCSKG